MCIKLELNYYSKGTQYSGFISSLYIALSGDEKDKLIPVFTLPKFDKFINIFFGIQPDIFILINPLVNFNN